MTALWGWPMPPASADGKREAEEAWGGMHILVAMLI